MACSHEKRSGCKERKREGDLLDQRPKRFSTFVVSIVCMERGSTLMMGFSDRKGMFAVMRAQYTGIPGMRRRLEGLNGAEGDLAACV